MEEKNSSNESMQLRSHCDGSCLPFPSTTPDERGGGGIYSGRLRQRHQSNSSSNNSREGTPLRNHVHHQPHSHVHLQSQSVTLSTNLQPQVVIGNGVSQQIIETQQITDAQQKCFSVTKTNARVERASVTMESRHLSLSSIGSYTTNRTRDILSSSSSANLSTNLDNSLSSSIIHQNYYQLPNRLSANDNRMAINGSRGDNLTLFTNEYGLDEDDSDSESECVFRITKSKTSSTVREQDVAVEQTWKIISLLYYIFHRPVYYVYKLSCYAMLLDLLILSSLGPFVQKFVNKHFKKFVIFFLLFSFFTLLNSSNVFSSLSEKSLSNLSSTLLAVPSSAAVYFSWLFNFAWLNQRQEQSTHQQVTLDRQVTLDETELRLNLKTYIEEQLKVQIEEKLKQIQITNTKEVKDEDYKVQLAELLGQLLSIKSEMKALGERLEEVGQTKLTTPLQATLNLSEYTSWLNQWLINTLTDQLSEEDTEKLAQHLKKWFTARVDHTKLVASMLELKMSFEQLSKDRKEASVSSYDEKELLILIRKELALYDADKLGLADYALESAGGSVINTRCTETYTKQSSQLVVLGVPLWHISSTPRTVIQSGRQPGECWPFIGSEGFIVVKLARKIRPTAFSLEHIPKTISPSGNIDTAPKDFSVWGLKSEMDVGVLLGKYQYDQDGSPLQTFLVQSENVDEFELIELRIHSNHGHAEFTCLYRFRVHGLLAI
ncbi:Secreted beta-glucosidase sun1 [Chamberlinius hualienensis]